VAERKPSPHRESLLRRIDAPVERYASPDAWIPFDRDAEGRAGPGRWLRVEPRSLLGLADGEIQDVVIRGETFRVVDWDTVKAVIERYLAAPAGGAW
jgi:hypothetical protein